MIPREIYMMEALRLEIRAASTHTSPAEVGELRRMAADMARHGWGDEDGLSDNEKGAQGLMDALGLGGRDQPDPEMDLDEFEMERTDDPTPIRRSEPHATEIMAATDPCCGDETEPTCCMRETEE